MHSFSCNHRSQLWSKTAIFIKKKQFIWKIVLNERLNVIFLVLDGIFQPFIQLSDPKWCQFLHLNSTYITLLSHPLINLSIFDKHHIIYCFPIFLLVKQTLHFRCDCNNNNNNIFSRLWSTVSRKKLQMRRFGYKRRTPHRVKKIHVIPI